MTDYRAKAKKALQNLGMMRMAPQPSADSPDYAAQGAMGGSGYGDLPDTQAPMDMRTPGGPDLAAQGAMGSEPTAPAGAGNMQQFLARLRKMQASGAFQQMQQPQMPMSGSGIDPSLWHIGGR